MNAMDGAPHEVHAALTAHFALLRRPRRDSDATDKEFVPPLIERYGLIPQQARVVLLPGHAKVWITPGSKGAALTREAISAHGRGSHFGSVDRICAHGLWGLTENLDGGRSLTGLVPDGNDRVSVVRADGSDETITPVDGIVFLTRIDDVKELVFLDAYESQQRQGC
jgi:hypothetical protein